ncbi:hypothetical protein NC651_029443 [Populus alba x Populus x berolinensis]|nr:hypothetical protein NC651_029443 [Populus alba x Populus x berolinensis]
MLTLPSDRGLECSAAISNLYPNRKPYMQSSNMFSDPHTSLGDEPLSGQAEPNSLAVADCKCAKAIPHGNNGYPRLQSNTLHGLAFELPYSPRRYTAKNFVKFGGARDTDHPAIRQPSALDIWTNLLFA